jgi:hypothetical protein
VYIGPPSEELVSTTLEDGVLPSYRCEVEVAIGGSFYKNGVAWTVC